MNKLPTEEEIVAILSPVISALRRTIGNSTITISCSQRDDDGRMRDANLLTASHIVIGTRKPPA